MKKSLYIIIILFIIILGFTLLFMINLQNTYKKIQKENYIYEKCLNKEVMGTEVASLINKAVDNNEKYNIGKDENENYVDDNEYCIKIYVKLQTNGKYFNMESIYNNNVAEFVKNFNLENFKCTKITYHDSTKRVSKVYFEILNS